MALTPRLELRQGQTLVMTPQLQQAIKLLQLSNLDLADYVDKELESNPLLEEAREDAAPAETGAEDRADGPDGSGDNNIGDTGDGDAGGDGADSGLSDDGPAPDELALSNDGPLPSETSDLDTDFDNVYSDEAVADVKATTSDAEAPAADGPGADGPGAVDWQASRSGSNGGGENVLEATVSRPPTLSEHLTDQLHMAASDPLVRFIGATIIDQLDEAGYLREPVEELAARIGAEEDQVLSALNIVQSFEPTGVGARHLTECLALQLKEMDRLDPIMVQFLDHIELFAKRDIAQLTKVLGVDGDDIQSLVADVRRCNPKPGLAFGFEPVQPVVPDVFVYEQREGGWRVELNSETLPKVLVNSQYHAEISALSKDADTKTFLSECLANANWLVKSLDQRARTILKVSSEIVRQQDAFLALGVQHLKPLNLKAIADAISMHESTVSRVTANKYIATPRGIFEMKYFFTSAIAATSGGDAYSAEAVRQRIKDMIDNECAEAVLSDDTIVAMLRETGIDIARRTVAKYREALHIPSSVQRRREKKAYA